MKRKRLSAPRKTGHGFKRSPYGEPDYKKKRYAMYRAPRLGWAQEYVTKLRFIAIGPLNSAGNITANYRWTSNAFDVDPATGGTAMPGFAEYAVFYKRFRTLKIDYEVELMNREAFPIVGMSGLTMENSPVVNHQNCGNPNWKIGTMGPLTGFNKLKLKDSKSIRQVDGTNQSMYDDLFVGSTAGTPPSRLCNIFIAIDSPNAVFTAGGGADYMVKFDLTVQFFETNQLSV